MQWQAIVSLGILHAVFVFSILAYEQNQAPILQRHGLDHFNHWLEIWTFGLACLIPPLAGWLSDRYAISHGKRFLVINTAVAVTAMLFIAVALTNSNEPGSGLAKALPVMMLFWVAGMHFFHSPTHSFVREYAPKKDWPVANAVILLIAGLIVAGQMFLTEVINAAGVFWTFVSGGVLLSLSAWWFVRSSQEKLHPVQNAEFSVGSWWQPTAYGLICGLSVTIFGLLLNDMPYGELKLGAENQYLAPLTLAILAVAGIPIGMYAEKVGVDRLFKWAVPAFSLMAALGFAATAWAPGWAILPFLALAYAALQVCCLPKALQYAEDGNSGFITGMYWAGFNLVPLLFFFGLHGA